MKYFGILLIFISFAANAKRLPIVTNAEGSNYQFIRAVHLDATPVQNQGYSGTCWSFSGMSFFESEMMRMGQAPIMLSEMYMARKAYEKKAEMYVRLDGKTNFGEGGEFHDLPSIIAEFGVVPQDIYTGLNAGAERHDHSEMFSVLKGAIDGVISHMKGDDFNGLSVVWKAAVSGILDAYLGADIKTFEYKGKSYTPQTFAQSLNLDMTNYLSITSFTNHAMYEKCQLAIPDNWAREESYNVPLEEMYDATIKALQNGYTVGWTADVSEAGFSHKKGLAINPVDTDLLTAEENNAFMNPTKEIEVSQEARQVGYDNKTTQDDHLMHIIGLYKDQQGKVYFLVKNSWGTSNYPEGYLYVSESYFKMKTIYVYMHKDAVEKTLMKSIKK